MKVYLPGLHSPSIQNGVGALQLLLPMHSTINKISAMKCATRILITVDPQYECICMVTVFHFGLILTLPAHILAENIVIFVENKI